MKLFDVIKHPITLLNSSETKPAGFGVLPDPMRSLKIKIIEDESLASAREMEQAVIENPVADVETGNEKIKEIIENSFVNVFSKENNEDVRIESQKDHGKIKKVGTLLRNALLFDGGALDLLKKLFIQEYGNDDNLKESEVDAYIKRFCLSNLNNIACESADTKLAIEAVCNKDNNAVAVEEEKVDEELKKEINDTWNKICDLADGLNKQTNIDWESGQYVEDSVAFFKEEADKVNALIDEINGRVKSDGSISEYSDEVLSFFQSHIEKLAQLQDEYEKNKEQFKRVESKKDKQNFENCKKLVVNIFDIAKDEIGKTQFAVNLKDKQHYLENFDQIKTEDLSEEESKEFEGLVAGAKKEISKILEKRKKDLSETEKKKKPVVKKVETKVDVEKNENIEDENSKIASEFRNAARNIIEKHLSVERFEKEFGISLVDKLASGDDMVKKLMEYADLIEFEHTDAASREQHKDFWDSLAFYQEFVGKINDPNYPKRLVVIEGKTYMVDRNFKPDAVVEGKTEEKNEKDPNEVFELSLELAKDFRDKLVILLRGNEEYKKLRTEYQESFLEGQVVAFLDELLEQEKVVADDKKEVFIKKVLTELVK
ncbi:MAG: hypothetical protein US70_C0001G0030 [Parcubacteria group bacterium GW2011_GWD2_38_11]|nr:MAG: hypothetical protein US70_C0001G0030 [Parcubacteria group bacterium GW2011_GWD2_38_11]